MGKEVIAILLFLVILLASLLSFFSYYKPPYTENIIPIENTEQFSYTLRANTVIYIPVNQEGVVDYEINSEAPLAFYFVKGKEDYARFVRDEQFAYYAGCFGKTQNVYLGSCNILTGGLLLFNPGAVESKVDIKMDNNKETFRIDSVNYASKDTKESITEELPDVTQEEKKDESSVIEKKSIPLGLDCGYEGGPCCAEIINIERGYVWCNDPFSCVANRLNENIYTCMGIDSKNYGGIGKVNMHYYYKPNKDSPPKNSYPLINCYGNNDCKKIEVPQKFRGKIMLFCITDSTVKIFTPKTEGVCLWV